MQPFLNLLKQKHSNCNGQSKIGQIDDDVFVDKENAEEEEVTIIRTGKNWEKTEARRRRKELLKDLIIWEYSISTIK